MLLTGPLSGQDEGTSTGHGSPMHLGTPSAMLRTHQRGAGPEPRPHPRAGVHKALSPHPLTYLHPSCIPAVSLCAEQTLSLLPPSAHLLGSHVCPPTHHVLILQLSLPLTTAPDLLFSLGRVPQTFLLSVSVSCVCVYVRVCAYVCVCVYTAFCLSPFSLLPLFPSLLPTAHSSQAPTESTQPGYVCACVRMHVCVGVGAHPRAMGMFASHPGHSMVEDMLLPHHLIHC